MKLLSHLPLAGSAGHDAVTEGRVCADMLLTVDLIESQAPSLGFPAPSSCVLQFPCTSVTTLRVPFFMSKVTDDSRE